ncbi:MAG: hypothetical protein ABW175_22100 [Bradyrhizobium sp.]
MTNEDKRNEHRKLFATWMNTLATGIITVGTLIPIGQWVYGFMPATAAPDTIWGTGVVCVGTGFVLHLLGHWMLRGLE